MLKLILPPVELFNDETSTFIPQPEVTISLEHSLVSISKWESKWKKPFLSKGEKSVQETIDYVRCMTISKNIPEDVYSRLNNQHLTLINNYIDDEMTATTFNSQGGTNREIITSELIYYWMIALNIPFECQKWHLNRLLVLINICNIKNSPSKKMGKNDLLKRNAELNAQRRAAMSSKG